jgi:hypothetical protein
MIMATNLDLVASIVSNPEAHQVDRKDKMNRTLDVMCSNMNKKLEQSISADRTFSPNDRGYGHGRKMAD